ncbi:MAG: radical SAM protein [bacterium]|nr:radical SAM protein [bacterium]
MNESASSPVRPSSVYGPVRSWRFGRSLGIDPILEVSTCTFNCIYCQLGAIERVTTERRVFVSTGEVRRDLEGVDWARVDVVTISGSGEPTLAANLDEIIAAIRVRTVRPVHLLTNATLFHLPEVRRQAAGADLIACKLDVLSEAMLRRVNRPAEGVTLARLVEGLAALKSEFRGRLMLQVMCLPANRREIAGLAPLVRRIGPDEIQLNTPRRPYPRLRRLVHRGDHDAQPTPGQSTGLKVVTREEAAVIERYLRDETGIPVISVYHD